MYFFIPSRRLIFRLTCGWPFRNIFGIIVNFMAAKKKIFSSCLLLHRIASYSHLHRISRRDMWCARSSEIHDKTTIATLIHFIVVVVIVIVCRFRVRYLFELGNLPLQNDLFVVFAFGFCFFVVSPHLS